MSGSVCAAKPAAPADVRAEHTSSRIAGLPTQHRKVGKLPSRNAAQITLQPCRRCAGPGVRRQRLGGRERLGGCPRGVAAAGSCAVHRCMQHAWGAGPGRWRRPAFAGSKLLGRQDDDMQRAEPQALRPSHHTLGL